MMCTTTRVWRKQNYSLLFCFVYANTPDERSYVWCFLAWNGTLHQLSSGSQDYRKTIKRHQDNAFVMKVVSIMQQAQLPACRLW